VDCAKRVDVSVVVAFTMPAVTTIVERDVAMESPRLMKAALEPIWRESTVRDDM
jgi:hypothetical protein